MCKLYHKLPTDYFITEMDPVLKQWMYENWIQDKSDSIEIGKNLVYLLASFDHSETVKQILGQGSHVSTDEEFEESTDLVKQINAFNEEKNGSSRRKRRKLIE